MQQVNKKAGVVLTMSVFGFLIVVGLIFMWLSVEKVDDFIGNKQLSLLMLGKDAEKAQFFIERSADVAAKNALYETVSDASSCGTYLGYMRLGSTCAVNLDDVKQKYLANFKTEFDKVLLTYTKANLFKENYDISFSESSSKSSSTTQEQENAAQAGSPKMEWPVNGMISSCFGYRNLAGKRQWHDGIDIYAAENTDVKAPADGVVEKICSDWTGACACSIFDKNCPSSCDGKCGNYGNYVIIKHSNDLYTRMSHLKEVLVKEGDKVMGGDVVAKSGNTGSSEGPHLDFKVYLSSDFTADVGEGTYDRNPLCYLPEIPQEMFLKEVAASCYDEDGTGIQFCSGKGSTDSISLRGIAKLPFVFGTGVIFKDVKMTAYRVSLESDYDVWSTGELPTEKGQREGTGFCSISESKRGFYEDVLCQGTGLGINGDYYYYETITHSKETSQIGTKKQTASGTDLVAHRTAAVSFDMIPKGSTIKITYKDCQDQACCDSWSGIYVAEDTGGAMIADWKKGIPHIDVFAGYGEAASKEASCIGLAKADVEVISSAADVSNHEGSMQYYLKSNFFATLDYSFSEFSQVISDLNLISEKVSKECSGGDKTNCISNKLKEKSAELKLKWTASCDTPEESAFNYLVEGITLCLNSNKEGYCEIPLTAEMRANIKIARDAAANTMQIKTDSASENIAQGYPTHSFFKEDKFESTTCEEMELDIQNKRAEIKCTSGGTRFSANYDGNIVLYNKLSPEEKLSTLSFLTGNFDKNKLTKIELSSEEYRICAQSKFILFMNGIFEPLIYKVAFSPEDKVPPEKAGFDIKAKENADSVMIVEITKPAEGASVYEVYYSEIKFSDISGAVFLDKMQTEKEFAMTKAGSYYFAVVPVDEKGNKETVVESVLAEAKDNLRPGPVLGLTASLVEPIDEIRPSFNLEIVKPTKNTDDSDLTDLRGYSFFLSEAIGDSCSLSDASIAINNALNTRITPISGNLDSAVIQISNKDKAYCLLVIAEDENQDAISESRYSEESIVLLK
ncbi:peptidoglycan DD-metalloendopeptidase family protein [Candidatus Woesearchaeota archaeon]|nr:peptidoglycan DD-metalloendopeptidase family protein [Candidatus Woesearchaeota archaeon]